MLVTLFDEGQPVLQKSFPRLTDDVHRISDIPQAQLCPRGS